MAILITINGTDRTNYVDLRSVTITNTVQANADTADFDISLSTTDGWTPFAGNEVVVTNGTSREFAGIVEDVYEELKGPSRLRYQVGARDYMFLFDKFLVVDESTATASADSLVTSIITNFTTGFTAANVMPAPNVPARKLDYLAPSEAIRGLADEVGYVWYIDYNKDVHFVDPSTLSAPTTSLNVDSNTSDYGDLRLRESASGVKNRVYMKDYRHKSTVTWNRQFQGDGFTRFFGLGQEPASLAGADMVATIDGANLDLLTDFVDGSPGTAVGTSSQLFICFTNEGARTSSGVSAFTSTQSLTIDYAYMEDAVTQTQNLLAQADMQIREGSADGVHEYVVADPGMTSADGSDSLALYRGERVLLRYGYARLSGSFTSYKQGWQAGQAFTLSSTKRMGGTAAGTFYVLQVNKSIVNHPSGGSPLFKYVVEISDGPAGI